MYSARHTHAHLNVVLIFYRWESKQLGSNRQSALRKPRKSRFPTPINNGRIACNFDMRETALPHNNPASRAPCCHLGPALVPTQLVKANVFLGARVESTYCCPVSKCSAKKGRTSLVIRELLPQ